jgi:E3 ubiquitin-protein ligase HECTD1
VLTIIEELMNKKQEEFLDHFARLGVFSKVQALMGTGGVEVEIDVNVIKSQEDAACSRKGKIFIRKKCFKLFIYCLIRSDAPSTSSTSTEPQEDAKEILPGRAYHWHEWSICRGRDCLYIWSDSAALELSNGSNGWFRFILDGKLATMYSSGSPENGNDSSGMSNYWKFYVTNFFMLTLKIMI